VPNDRVVTRRIGCRMIALGPSLATRALGIREYGLHAHTVDQELRTLHNRHLFETPEPDMWCPEWHGFKKQLRLLADEIGYVPIATNMQVLEGKFGRIRKRMREGLNQYYREGVERKQSRLTEMQKLEFYEVDKLAGKEDRGIQYRTVVYNAALSRHLRNIEHRLMSCVGRNKSGLPFMAKGRSLDERAVLLLRMADGYTNPVFVNLDHARFDAHMHYKLIVAEHSVYKRCRNWHPELVKLLNWQLTATGISKGGVKYMTRGKRGSGDVNTGLGNSEVNAGFIFSWLEASGVRGDVLLDGDDAVIIVEKSDYDKLLPIEEYMLKLGMETVVERVDDISEVEFCQARVVLGKFGPYFCGNPLKFLETMTMTAETRGAESAFQVFRSSVVGLATQNPSCPMLKPFLKWCEANPGFAVMPQSMRYRMRTYKMGPVAVVPLWEEPTMEQRLSFGKAWGISPAEQIAFEDSATVDAILRRVRESKVRVKPESATEGLLFDDGWVDQGYVEDSLDLLWGNQTVEFREYWKKQIA